MRIIRVAARATILMKSEYMTNSYQPLVGGGEMHATAIYMS